MGWFKKTINSIVKKKASREEAINKALNQLQQGVPSFQIANNFVREMIIEDTNFTNSPEASQIMGAMGNPEELTLILTNLGSSQQVQEPEYPIINIPDSDVSVMEEVPGEAYRESPEEDGISTNPEDVNDAATTSDKEVSEEGIIGDEEVLTKQLDAPPSFEKRISSDPTMLETFELPVNQVKTARNKLATINKKLRDMYYSEVKIEFVGDAYNKPVHYSNRIVQEPYIQVRISGTLPSPSEEISIKKQEPTVQKDGTTVMKTVGHEPKGVRLIAKIIHKELDEQTQQKYLQTLEPNSPLRSVINQAKEAGETPFFNVVEPLDGAPPIDGKFWYSSPQECVACKVKKAGASARKSTYVGVIVPPEQMIPKTANINGVDTVLTRRIMNPKTKQLEEQPIRIIPNELIENAQQEQFGGKCIDPFDATKTITALKNWVKNTKKVKEEYEKKRSKSRHKGGGWGRNALPTDNLLSVAVNLLRDERYKNNLGYAASRLGWQTSIYQRSLKPNVNKGYNSYDIRARRNAPYITDEDKQIGSDVANWWREKLGGIDVQNEDKNKITLSVVPDIGVTPANMRDVIGMVKTYLDQNHIQLDPAQERPTEPESERQKTILEEPVVEESVVEEPVVEEPVVEEPVVEEPVVEEPAILDNIEEIEEGSAFVAKLKYLKSFSFRRGASFVNKFRGPTGAEYISFSNKEPFNAQEGEEIYVRGIKGTKNTRYNNTQLQKLVKVSPDKIRQHEESINDPIVKETPISPEAPSIPEAATQKELNPVEKATERAKSVIQKGSTASGGLMTPETLIPLYVDQLVKNVPGLRKEDYISSLNKIYQRGGKDGLMRYLDTIPGYLENYIK